MENNTPSAPVGGETLPQVLTSNTTSLVNSINSFTSQFASKFDYYFMGLLTYMDLFVTHNEKQLELTELQKNKLKFEEKKDDNGITPREIVLTKDKAIIESLEFQKSTVSGGVLSATDVSGLSPREIQVSKYL